jgi:hypothetical protein
MSASIANHPHSHIDFGASFAIGAVKRFLNQLSERAQSAADRSRLAALPSRYLDDVGMTVGERAEVLGYEEPALDSWGLVASQRL